MADQDIGLSRGPGGRARLALPARRTGWALGPAAGLAAVLVLAGCGLAPGGPGAEAPLAPGAEAEPQTREVEAPEILDLSARGVWDGRPSLGGVWVAHAATTDPRRVLVRNPATGRAVGAALFRRERENPGPPLQVSADAAAALGMVPGQPALLQVVALRREAAAPADAGPETETGTETEVEAEPGSVPFWRRLLPSGPAASAGGAAPADPGDARPQSRPPTAAPAGPRTPTPRARPTAPPA